MKKYLDKNGVEIKPGSIINCGDGKPEKVYITEDDRLGICATNPKYLEHHPDADIEYYPLDGNFHCTIQNEVVQMLDIEVVS